MRVDAIDDDTRFRHAGRPAAVALAAAARRDSGRRAAGLRLRSRSKVALQGDTSNVDLHLTTHYVSRVALLNVYEMLYTLGEDLSIQPMLADKAHRSAPTASLYTITVRKGVEVPQRQGDGRIRTWRTRCNRMRNQGCRSAEFKALVKEFEATDALDGPHHPERSRRACSSRTSPTSSARS